MPRPVNALVRPENPNLWLKEMAKDVVREDADRFTTLFPIRMALRSWVGFSINLKTSPAFFTFSSAMDCIRILFTVVKQVSADEKKAESTNRINKTMIRQASLESK